MWGPQQDTREAEHDGSPNDRGVVGPDFGPVSPGLNLPLQIRAARSPHNPPPTHVPALTYCSWGPDLSLHHSPPTAWILWLLPSSLLQERALLPASGLQDSNGGGACLVPGHTGQPLPAPWTWQAM